MTHPVDVDAFRAKLVAQGAVDFFEHKTPNDELAETAIRGFYWAMPGSGLYKDSDTHYHMRISKYGFETDKHYDKYTPDEWRAILLNRDRRLRFMRRKIETIWDPSHSVHTLVYFEIVAGD